MSEHYCTYKDGMCELDVDKAYTEGYEKGRADQKKEDNEFFNFEGAWELEKQKIKADTIEEVKSLLRCRNYRGCVAGKGCDGVCRIDSDICKKCENFGIPYLLLEQMQKGAEEWLKILYVRPVQIYIHLYVMNVIAIMSIQRLYRVNLFLNFYN